MRQYDLTAVHDAVGNAYTEAQNLEDEEFREEMIAGVIDVARQVRAAEEMEGDLYEALEHGAEGMADVYVKEQAKKQQAQGYRETMADMLGAEGSNPLDAIEAIAGRPEASAKKAEQLEELKDHLGYAEDAQRDAIGAERVAEETATAYGGSFGVLLEEYEELQDKVASDLVEGDEDMKVAMTAIQGINPGEEDIKLGI